MPTGQQTADSVEVLRAADLNGESVETAISNAIARIGENMTLRRAVKLSVEDGVVATYIHNAASEGLGKLGVLVALKSTGNKDVLAAIGRQVAMHIAATAQRQTMRRASSRRCACAWASLAGKAL